MKKTLPSIRVEQETQEKISMAIERFNETSIIKLTKQEFRRLSYEYFSQIILQKKEQEIKKLLQLQ